MSKGQKLRALVNERLTAAAEEIFELFERTIAEYEEEVHRVKQRNNTQQRLLDQVLEPRVVLHKTGVQIVSVKSLKDVKEEPEEEQLQEFPFTPVFVKTEDDEDKSSVLHQRPTEENREEPNGEDCGAEAGCSSDPLTHLHSDSYSASDTDRSEDWTPDETSKKGNSATINPDFSESDVGENSKEHKCSECGKRFERKDHLQKHASIHTGQKPFQCQVCKKTFAVKAYLNAHMKIHSAERPFICSVCLKCFKHPGALRKHIKTHSSEKPFSCSVCAKGFIQRVHLKEHMNKHTGERPFKCELCPKGFLYRKCLDIHLRTHTQEKPFSCSVCKKQFAQSGNLKEHMKTHTGEKRYNCPICEKGYTKNSALKLHMTEHLKEWIQDRTEPETNAMTTRKKDD